MKKPCIVIFAGFFLLYTLAPLYAYTKIPEYLCELGMKFYSQGRYNDALNEFKKALLVSPEYGPALKYIQMIEGKQPQEAPFESEFPAIESLIKPEYPEVEAKVLPLAKPEKKASPEKIILPKVLKLDESLSSILQPIEIEQGKSAIVIGRNIQRFLATQPGILSIERKSADELLLTAKEIGYTYVHIWDDNGRWTTEWLGAFPKPAEPSYAEILEESERARSFRLNYTLDWASSESGRRINKLDRLSYQWAHNLRLDGESPYGNLDSSFSIRRLNKSAFDLTYLTLGLKDGHLGAFKGFGLRAFDYSPYFSNLIFGGATLRGVMLDSPAFEKKLNYSAFWGREGGGRYGNLSPNLSKIRHSFLEGLNLDFSPTKAQDYQFSLVHGRGRDRDNTLNSKGYDLLSRWNFDKWGLGYEIANDSETFAHLLNTRYRRNKFNLSAEFRNIDKNFTSTTGRGFRQGELGASLNLGYSPTEKLGMDSRLGIYLDRLFPAEDDNDRWNEDFNWGANYTIDSLTSLNLMYSIQNDLGRISQSRNQNTGFGLNRTFKLKRDIRTHFNYNYQESKNFSSPSSDYNNSRIHSGLRFSLIGDLNYYFNKEFNWVHERFTGASSKPNAFETGLDWYGKFGKTPLKGNFRLTYRDEEDTVSGLSFLAGEDYLEGYSELSYQLSPDNELYSSCRIRNVWAESPNTTKRIEANFNAGMRYLWDTGVRWESVGNIEGYVFKDLNSDGLRQRDEPPIEGIKLQLGKGKSETTDLLGYYKFKGIRARKAYVSFDTSTIPEGYILTVPAVQEIAIEHNRTVRANFGIISRSEISGYVFEDADNNGQYSSGDKGVLGTIVTLEDGKKTATDNFGRYSFANVSPGEHTIALDLNSIPIYYLPQATLTKKITLFEGVTYLYNVPLKKIKE